MCFIMRESMASEQVCQRNRIYSRSSEYQTMDRQKLVVTEGQFTKNLMEILKEEQSNYSVSYFDVDMSTQKALYAYIWSEMVEGGGHRHYYFGRP